MAAYSGFSATLGIGAADGPPETFTTIVQVRDINGPNQSTDTIETSSRASAWKTFVAGMRDAGELTFDIVFDPDTATHKATTPGLLYDFGVGTLRNFKLTFPDATPATAIFAAVITGFDIGLPYNDAMTADVSLKLSGAITWA